MKKVNIVTYCTYSSFGSVLQSLGLTRALQQTGCSPVLWLDSEQNRFTCVRVRSGKDLLRRLFQLLIGKKRRTAYRKRMEFLGAHLQVRNFDRAEDMETAAAADDAVCFLAGSDQVWNPRCDPVFFLDFVRETKCISYAASMGSTVIPPEKQKQLKQYLSRFSHISVREQECADVIRAYTDRPVSVHIDPTFLVSAADWRTYAVPYPVREPYILVYMLYWNPACREKIKTLKQKTGLPVYAVTDGLSRVYADRHLYDVGIGEFLWLIDHASYVVTSSFHGTAFSVLFQKKFAAVINPAAPSRITHLLRTLSLPVTDIAALDTADGYDYAKTDEIIRSEREKSLSYLQNAIG